MLVALTAGVSTKQTRLKVAILPPSIHHRPEGRSLAQNGAYTLTAANASIYRRIHSTPSLISRTHNSKSLVRTIFCSIQLTYYRRQHATGADGRTRSNVIVNHIIRSLTIRACVKTRPLRVTQERFSWAILEHIIEFDMRPTRQLPSQCIACLSGWPFRSLPK